MRTGWTPVPSSQSTVATSRSPEPDDEAVTLVKPTDEPALPNMVLPVDTEMMLGTRAETGGGVAVGAGVDVGRGTAVAAGMGVAAGTSVAGRAGAAV